MVLKELIKRLGSVNDTPCVSISLETHRTSPDNEKDKLRMKNLLKEAEDRLVSEYGETKVSGLLAMMESLPDEIDVRRNLDSLHIFLSDDVKEVVRLPQAWQGGTVQISSTFALRPLIKAYSRSTPYLIMLLSQGGAHLYEASNDGIIQEIIDGGFPFPENDPSTFYQNKKSDPDYMDDLVKDYFNKVDKALVSVHNNTDLECVVACTTDNYSMLMQVADKPDAYLGHIQLDYNNSAPHQLARQAWELMKKLKHQQKTEAIQEMTEAVARGTVQTDLQEIYRSAIDGRGELLIAHENFQQPVRMKDDRTFEIVEDPTAPGVVDDITSDIAWHVLENNGKTIFTTQDDIKDLGKIVLKTRY